MVMAVIFSVSVVLGIIFIAQSSLPVAWRAVFTLGLALFAVFAYLFATLSGVSPFSAGSGRGFGFWDQSIPVAVGVVGAVVGVAGSHLIKIGETPFARRVLLKPLLIAPVVIIPTIKLIESAGEQILVSMLLLFAVSYQNGFFWERIMKDGEPV